MDPRHPEQAVTRMRELMKQYDRIEKDIANAPTSAQLGELEREGGLVIQEICLVAPRIHEAMMQAARMRRHEISHGLIKKSFHRADVVTDVEDSYKVKEVKKKTTKKKTTKKAKK